MRSSTGSRRSRLVSANAGRRNRGQSLGNRQRLVEQTLGVDDGVDDAALQRFVGGEGRAAVEQRLQVRRRHREPHHFERHDRKRHADEQLGDADAAAVARHQTLVGRRRR